MSHHYLPMYAQSADKPFSGKDWLFEIKWDGVRAIAYVNDSLSLRSRNDHELAGQFPELGELLSLAPHTVLDGEIVVMTGGKPDIQALLPRLHAGSMPGHGTNPVTYIVFDILEKDGMPVTGLPLTERRTILEQSIREGPHVVLSVPVEGRGGDYYRAAIGRGLEGIIAKRKDSVYEPGLRSPDWLKIKAQKSCDCVIGGYTRGQGGRSPSFGALLLGLYETGDSRNPGDTGKYPHSHGSGSQESVADRKRLVYIGKVGSGFTDQDHADLMEMFSRLKSDVPYLAGAGPGEKAVWLEPVLVCEVAYQEVTRAGKLRIPRFIRIRSDKQPAECTLDQLAVQEISDKEQPVENDHGRESGRQQNMRAYQEKRDFSVTGEPEGMRDMEGKGNYFVIQEHHAHHLHYDLRLERDGVLKSWAVPKGIPEVPGEKHLAVAVEDHPLDYGHFEGTIPEGQYGAGTVTIWDNGTYDTKHWDEGKIEIRLHGKRLNGSYVLVRFKRAGKNEWLVFRAGE